MGCIARVLFASIMFLAYSCSIYFANSYFVDRRLQKRLELQRIQTRMDMSNNWHYNPNTRNWDILQIPTTIAPSTLISNSQFQNYNYNEPRSQQQEQKHQQLQQQQQQQGVNYQQEHHHHHHHRNYYYHQKQDQQQSQQQQQQQHREDNSLLPLYNYNPLNIPEGRHTKYGYIENYGPLRIFNNVRSISKCIGNMAKHFCYNHGICYKVSFYNLHEITTYFCQCLNDRFGERCEYQTFDSKNNQILQK
ncbi:putative protein [Kallithea virus]|uniref:EGF-like domain-containing protein n=1 Tax=Kallithea virus TaxID=1654582 RepID=A0A1S5VFY0_9VIRU|nr:hypothetical protein B2K52_gp031 [Kallithea virus]AQN78555.1 putative protein [Kallithea virus]